MDKKSREDWITLSYVVVATLVLIYTIKLLALNLAGVP